MTKEIQSKAARLLTMRQKAKAEEEHLRQMLHKALSHGDARAFCTTVGVSPAYLSDIRHGNRGIGDELLAKIAEMERAA